MPRRWQYQEKVQPVVTPPNTAETVHPEAWMQPPTPPQRNWAIAAAAFVIVLSTASGSQRNFDVKDYPGNGNWRPEYTSIVPRSPQWNYYAALSASSGQAPSDVEQASEPEEPFLDKFGQPPPSQYLRRRNYGVCSGSAFVPPPPVFLDRWWQPTSQPTYRPQGYPAALSASSGNERNFGVLDYPGNGSWRPEFPAIVPIQLKRTADLTQTVAPITVPAETVTIDKWFEPPSQPLKQPYPFDLFTVPGHQQAFAYIHGYEDHWHPNYPASIARPYPEAAYAASGSSAPVFTPAAAETITIDKWFEPVSQPTYQPRRSEQGQSVTDPNLLTQKEQVTISKFKPAYPDWLPRPYPLDLFTVPGHQQAFAYIHGYEDHWHPNYPSSLPRPYPAATYIASGATGPFVFAAAAEVVTLDKWGQPSLQPSLRRRTGVCSGSVFVGGEVISLDKWFEPPSQPLFVPSRIASFAPEPSIVQVVAAAETITIDKWFEPVSQPTYQPRRNEPGQSVTDAKSLTQQETVSIDRFGPTYPVWNARPYPRATYTASGGIYITPIELILLDKWGQPASQPTYQVKRSAELGQSVNDPKLLTQKETVSVDKFKSTYPDSFPRPFSPAYLTSGYSSPFVVAATVVPGSIDAWGQPSSQSFLRRRTGVSSGSAFVGPSTAVVEVITIDKWWHEQPDPVRPPYPYDLFTVPGHQQAFLTLHGAYSPMYADYPSQFARPFAIATYAASGSVNVVSTAQEAVSTDKFKASYPDSIAKIPSFAALAPASVLPVLVSETITPDKWLPDYPVSLARAFSQATYVSGLAWSSGEVVSLDKWFEPPSQPTYLPKRVAELTQIVRDPGQAVLITEVPAVYPDRLVRPASQPASGAITAISTASEAVFVEKFQADYVDIAPRLAARCVVLGQTVIDPTVLLKSGELVTIDKWWQPAAQPTYLAKRCPELGQSVIDPKLLTQKEAVHVDAWMEQPEYPAAYLSLQKKIYAAEAASGMAAIDAKQLTLQETVRIDKFNPNYPDRIPRLWPVATYTSGGLIVIIPPEVVTLDKWWQPASVPTRLPARTPDLTQTVIAPSELFSLDKWAPDYQAWVNRPFNSAVQQASGGIYIPQPPIETVTLDKWWKPASQPTYLPTRSADLTQTVIPPPEKILLDKWWQPTSQPTYLPKRSAELQQFIIDPKPETIRIDKWAPDYQAWVNRPFNSAVPAASGQTLVLTEIVSFDKWWQPASQPTYLAKRTAELGQSVIDAGALLRPETVSIDKFGPAYQSWINRTFDMAVLASSGAVFVELQPPNIGFIFASISVTPLVLGTPSVASQVVGTPSVNSAVIAASIKVAS
jgi:hypothetical protein